MIHKWQYINTPKLRIVTSLQSTYIDVSLCSFSKLSFKVAPAYMLPQSSDIRLQQVDKLPSKNQALCH